MVVDSWQKHHAIHGMEGIADRLARLERDLSPWGAREFGCLAKKVRALKKKLELLRR